ncbi:MAG TPA: hypothetical protein PLP23_18250 [Panacibacter sp.]|nr:hypothetical protein [Panacibacter sp.]
MKFHINNNALFALLVVGISVSFSFIYAAKKDKAFMNDTNIICYLQNLKTFDIKAATEAMIE